MDLKIELDGSRAVVVGDLTEKVDENLLRDTLRTAATAAGPEGRVLIDVEGIAHGNSTGLAKWIRVTSGLGIPITYVKVPPWLVYQFSDVRDFIGKGMWIESFYAPFYAPDIDRNITVLLTLGQDLPIKEEYSDEELTLERNGINYYPDFEPRHFLAFVSCIISEKEAS